MTVPCAHWSECGVPNGGCCARGLYGGKPSRSVCLRICTEYDGPARGAGDVVAKVVKVFGARKCGNCEKRQLALNAMTRTLTSWQ